MNVFDTKHHYHTLIDKLLDCSSLIKKMGVIVPSLFINTYNILCISSILKEKSAALCTASHVHAAPEKDSGALASVCFNKLLLYSHGGAEKTENEHFL